MEFNNVKSVSILYREMIRIESLQINLNRILLLAIGLWPYQQSKLVRAQLIILFSILITFIIFQVRYYTLYIFYVTA